MSEEFIDGLLENPTADPSEAVIPDPSEYNILEPVNGDMKFDTLGEFHIFKAACPVDLHDASTWYAHALTVHYPLAQQEEVDTILSDIEERGGEVTETQQLFDLRQRAKALETQWTDFLDSHEYRPVYEYYTFHASEGGLLTSGYREWSFGDKETGSVGVPVPQGAELIFIGFHADVFPTTGKVIIDIRDYFDADTPTVVHSIVVDGATDGGGEKNNATKQVHLPVNSPVLESVAPVVGVYTNHASGRISKARVSFNFRKQVGTALFLKEETNE